MVSDALKQQREQQRENKMNNALDDNKKESSNSVSVEEYKSKKRVEVRKGAEKATSLAHDIRSLALRASWLPDCSEETIKDRALDMERYLELFKGSRGEAYVGLLDLVSSEAVRKINTMESSTTFIEKVELSEENGKGAFEEELEGIKEKQFLMLKGALDSLDPEIKHEDASSYIDKEIDSALSISSRMLSIAIGTPESNRKDDIIAFNYEAGVTVKSLVELKDIILHRNIVYILRVFFKRGVPFNENFISNSIRQIVRDSASIMYNNISFSKPDTMIELGGTNKGGISKGIETKIISKIDEVCRLAEIKNGDRPEEKDNTVTVRPGIIRQSGMLPIDPRLVPERLSYEPELNSNGRNDSGLRSTIKECIHKAMIQVAKRLERSVDLVNDSKALSDNAFSEIMIAIESTEELYAAFRSEEDRSDAMFEELRLIIIHSIEDLGRSLGLNNTEQMERDDDKYAFIRHMVIEAISIITSRTDEYKEKESKAIVIEFVEKMAECFCLKVFKGSKQDLLVRHISCYLIRALEEIALDAYKGTSINNATREGDFEGDSIVYMAGLDLDPNRPPVLDISCGQSVEAKENKRSGEYPPIVDDREDMIDGWREVSTANEELEELVEKITEEEEDRIQSIAQYEDVVDFFYQVNDEPSCHPMIDEFEVESRALIESLLYDSKDDNIDMYSVSDGVVEYIRAIEDDIRKRLDCDLSNLEYKIVMETRTALISIVICLMDKKNECAKKDTYFTQDGFVAGCIKIIKEAVEKSEGYVATAEEKDEVIGESEAFKTWVEKMNEGARGLGARCSNRNK